MSRENKIGLMRLRKQFSEPSSGVTQIGKTCVKNLSFHVLAFHSKIFFFAGNLGFINCSRNSTGMNDMSKIRSFESESQNLLQTLFTLHIDEEYHICIPKTESQHYFAISTFLMFVIPMSVITILYILIGLQLRKSKIVQRGNINGSSVRLKVKLNFYF